MSRVRTFSLAVSYVAISSTVCLAQAGRYELAKYIPTGVHTDKSPVYQQNLELCKAYEANLNSFPKVTEPFACERPLNPKLRDFSKPKWKPLDAREHVKLLVEIARFRNRHQPQGFGEPAYRRGILEGIRLGQIRLKVAELDITPSPSSANRGPDGVPEKVLRIERGDPKCTPADEKTRRFPPVIDYVIVNDDLTKFEEFAPLRRTMDAFLYKGEVYFDVFYTTRAVDADSPDFDDPSRRQPVLEHNRYEIYVNEPRSNQVVSICRYRYVD